MDLDRAKKYGAWIIQNKDKKGTPEFEKVATAYKVARAGGLDAYAEGRAGPAKAQPNPMTFDSEGNVRSAGEKFLIGAGKGFADLGRGIGQMVGVVDEKDVDIAKERDAPINESGLGNAGQLTSQVAAFLPTAMIPGANTYTGSALIGGGIGATNQVGSGESRAKNALVSALAGTAGRAVFGGASRALNPKTSAEAKALLDDGVTLTPGQVMGGTGRRVEEGLKSVPILGDAIRNAEVRSMKDFNRATINNALKGIGGSVDDSGYTAVQSAHSQISKAYDDVLGQMPVELDRAAVDGLMSLNGLVSKGMAPAQRRRFAQIMNQRVLDKMTDSGKMSGTAFKNIDTDVGRLARQYGKSQDPEQQLLGDAFKEVQRLLRETAATQNPTLKPKLDAANAAYAQLIRIEKAAGGVGAKEGVFSPAQLRSASKALDPSLNKRQSAHGKALMQDAAEGAESVLGQTVPDSGTPFRLANMGLMMGGAIEPMSAALLAGGAGLGSTAYTQTGQKALINALTKRPEAIRALGNQVTRLNPYSAALAAPLAVQ